MVRLAVVVVICAAGLALVSPPTSASPRLQVALFDQAEALGNPDRFFTDVDLLKPQMIRINLNWGGRLAVSRQRPDVGTDPEDSGYDWAVYDRAVREASAIGVRVVFAIVGTPGWANGGARPAVAPRNPARLKEFAYAAATRYSGVYVRPDGVVLPAVRHWIAWNEPNLRLGLIPQYRRVKGRLVIASAREYAKICNAIYDGVHATLLGSERVACGATAPRGNNSPRLRRPSISPLAFLRAMKKAGARRFDAYAHHAYYGAPSETPTTKPRARTAVTLANIDALVAELTRLYGRKRVWISEYGYETFPPDGAFGVAWALQARYLDRAYTLASRHPRVDMLVWFLLRDEGRLKGWQSGLLTASGTRKPAYWAFQRMALFAESNRG